MTCMITGQVKVRTIQREVERLYHFLRATYVSDYLVSSTNKLILHFPIGFIVSEMIKKF